MNSIKNTLAVISCLALASCGGRGSGGTTTPPPDNPAKTAIYELQGAGPSSPLQGQTVSIGGIVTGDFQNNDADADNDLGGFYVQESTPDSDAATSDGIFVFDGDTPSVDVSVGDRVTIEGTVKEYFDETQVSAISVTVTGSGAIQPVEVNLPTDFEHYEGMLIRLPQALSVASLYELERFGTIQLVHGGRPFGYTSQNVPDVAGYSAHLADLAARTVLVDDGRNDENIYPIRFLNAGTSTGYSIRSGDTISRLTGNLRYSRGSGGSGTQGYRLVPVIDPLFETQNPRPAAPTVAGALRVVSFNTLNFFSTTDTATANCGPTGTSSCRGADSAQELERHLSKLVTALLMIDADIAGLIEIENNSGTAMQMIVDRLNREGNDNYAFVNAGAIGTDAITTGFVFKTSSVSLNGSAVILDSSVDLRFADNRNRPALAQSFTRTANGAVFSVVVNHLKSKGSSCDSDGDPDLNDGQGNCNVTRTNAAAALADWVALDPTGSGDADYLVIGDLNAYTFEDPLTTLKNSGLTSLLEVAAGDSAWSFAFGGEFGALDHALATASLAPQIAEVIEWHINADEPRAFDYNTEFGRDLALFDPNSPYRSSDHDPIIIGIDLTN